VPRYVAKFTKKVLTDSGHQSSIIQRAFDLDARDRDEASRLAKARFCDLEGNTKLVVTCRRYGFRGSGFSFVRAVGNQDSHPLPKCSCLDRGTRSFAGPLLGRPRCRSRGLPARLRNAGCSGAELLRWSSESARILPETPFRRSRSALIGFAEKVPSTARGYRQRQIRSADSNRVSNSHRLRITGSRPNPRGYHERAVTSPSAVQKALNASRPI
jgi:hypothetical protein